MTPSGIEPATFWFVAQASTNCATACPLKSHENKRMKILLAAECRRKGRSDISFEKSATNCLKFDALVIVFIVSIKPYALF